MDVAANKPHGFFTQQHGGSIQSAQIQGGNPRLVLPIQYPTKCKTLLQDMETEK